MHSTTARVTMKESEKHCVASLIKQQADRLMREEKGISTFKKAVKITVTILKNDYPNDTSRNIIAYVFRMYLLSLARKEKLDVAVFKNRQISTREICSVLYDSARKFSKTRSRLGIIRDFLRPQNVQTLIDNVAAQNSGDTQSQSPLTIRRSPVHQRRNVSLLSYA